MNSGLWKRTLCGAVLLTLLGACGGGEATSPAATQAPASVAPTQAAAATVAPAQPTAQPANAGGSSTNGDVVVVDLVVTGGPKAGTYHGRANDGGCSRGSSEEGAYWGNQFSVVSDDPNEFTSLQLIVQAPTDDIATGTSSFLTTASFGPILDPSAEYTINGLPDATGNGSGTVKVADAGSTATITINGTTADGVQLDATIHCNHILDFGALSGDTSDDSASPANSISLEISGDSDGAGTYVLEPEGDQSACGYGTNNYSVLAENLDLYDDINGATDALTFEYYDDAGASANEPVHSIQLLVPVASSGATNRFYLDIDDQTYYVENLAGDAAADVGTVNITKNGATATIAINAKTSDGSIINGTIQCNSFSE